LGNKKIFLVEDVANDVALTKRALQKSNICNELIVAEDGVEAVKYFFEENLPGRVKTTGKKKDKKHK